MEYSSPLAAMRPQPPPSWNSRRDVPVSRSMYQSYQTYGSNSFDFKTMSMNYQKPARPDYFTARTTKGSSPTSSLTADLDANFHIDKSPQAPTPRRALFTADLFQPRDDAGRLMTPPIEVEPTTPPVPSSSPAPDGMDISPLPHKAPFFQVTLPSPTPDITPASEADISPDLLSPQEEPMHLCLPTQPLSSLAVPERRRPGPRPSLFRAKALSANNVLPPRPVTAQNHLPAFRFGDVATSGLSSTSTPSLLETAVVQSPIDGSPSLAVQHPMAPPPRRPSIGANMARCGSPSLAHVRKPSGGRPAFTRPSRKLVRRSLSMFQHPDDVMKEEQQEAFEPQPCLAAVMDIEQQQHEHVHKLPHFVPDDEPDSLPRISQDTMVDILEEKYSSQYDRIVIVDCRFEYEYQGGHIERAVNFNDKQQLAQQLFEDNTSNHIQSSQQTSSTSSPSSSQPNTLLILHCEYSIHRAPLTAKFLRNHDRNVNALHYPRLTFPEMYILDGGYSKFFQSQPSKCFPQSYVEMKDSRHELACERGMAKVKANTTRQKLFRHQTFAFGQTGCDGMDASPTGIGRNGGVGNGGDLLGGSSMMGPRSQSSFHVGEEVARNIGLSFARRMASY